MNRPVKNILIGVGVFVVIIATYMITNSIADNRLIEKTKKVTKLQDSIEFLNTDIAIQKTGILSEKRITDSLSIIIEFQKNNPTVIIRENDRIKIDINRLDALNSIKLFSDNIKKYETNKERYSLHRFTNK